VTSAESTAGTVRIGSIAANAVNAAAIADGAIDTATFASGTTIPRVTLADTVTTNTDMRGTDGANTIAPTNLSAAQVRTELATELGRIDASISSRSTYAGGAVASVAAAVVLDSASITAVQSGLATAAAVTAEAIKTAAIKAKTDQFTFTVAGKVDATAVLDSASRVAIVDAVSTALAVVLKGGLTHSAALDLILAATIGKSSQPSSTTEKFKFVDNADAFTTTFDSSGNRTAVALS